MNLLHHLPPSPTSAQSDSHLATIPPVPPQSRPGLPPKQAINKSKEDMDRIDKVTAGWQEFTNKHYNFQEMLRKSGQIFNGQVMKDNQQLQVLFF